MTRSATKRARSGGHTEGGGGRDSGVKKQASAHASQAGAAVGLGGAARPLTQRSEQAAPCHYYHRVKQADGKPEWTPAQLVSLNEAKATEEHKFLRELTSHYARHGQLGWEPINWDGSPLEREGWWNEEDVGGIMESGSGQALAGWRHPPSLEDTLQRVLDARGGRCVNFFGSLNTFL